MRKAVFFVSIVLLLIGLVFPVPVLARTSPQSGFPVPTIYRTSVYYDALSGENVSVHIYSKCYDSNPPNGPWFVELVVQYDNEDAVAYSIDTVITADSLATSIGSVTGGTVSGSTGTPVTALHQIPGDAATYSNIDVSTTVNGTTQITSIGNAGCGPTNISLTSASASVASQGWLLVLPLTLLAVVTAVFLRRRV